MSEEWFDRLEECIARDKRSLRALSRDMGAGPNYVQQLLRDRKDPGFTKLSRLLNELGSGAALYVISGRNLTDQDAEFFEVALALPQNVRQEALSLFRALAAREADPSQVGETAD